MMARSSAAEAIFGSGRLQHRMQVALEVETKGLFVQRHRANVFSTPGPVSIDRVLSQARPTLFPTRK
jgi:hypothetical protein